jgi:hypothetical protein
MQSRKLGKTLELILSIGNYMNGDSFRGSAFGFSIDTLTKLADTKSSTNSKISILHFIAKTIDNKMPSCKGIFEDLPSLEKAMKVSLPAINQEVAEIVKGFKMIENEIQMTSSNGKTKDMFSSVMKASRTNQPYINEKLTIYKRKMYVGICGKI